MVEEAHINQNQSICFAMASICIRLCRCRKQSNSTMISPKIKELVIGTALPTRRAFF